MAFLRKRALALGKDNIFTIFWTFAIPSVLSMLAQTTAGLVDAVFIGRYVGPDGIGGITLFFPVLNFIVGFSSMVAIGGITEAGIRHGRGDLDGANNIFNVTLSIVMAIAVISSVITWFLADPDFLVRRLGLGATTSQLTREYARTLTWFYVPFLAHYILAFFVKLAGRPVIPVLTSVGGTIINIFLDWLLVARLNMGMTGAALATGFAQTLPTVLLIGILVSRTPWRFRRPVFRRQEIGRILYNGSSEFMTMASLAIAGFLYNWVILRNIGETGIAGYGITLQVSNFAIMVFYGLAEAVQSPVSFNFGAGSFSRVRSLRNMAGGTAFAIGAILFPLLFWAGDWVSGIFTRDAPTAAMSTLVLKFWALAFLPAGVNIVITTYYTSIYRPLASAALALLRSLLGLAVGLAILPRLFPENGIWMPLVFTELATLGAAVLMLVGHPLEKSKPNTT